jgi:hypothetical protein
MALTRPHIIQCWLVTFLNNYKRLKASVIKNVIHYIARGQTDATSLRARRVERQDLVTFAVRAVSNFYAPEEEEQRYMITGYM